jgi:hypothetical protein
MVSRQKDKTKVAEKGDHVISKIYNDHMLLICNQINGTGGKFAT